ncbi:YlbG family protein [Weissella sagaensis]|uniref:YlbG family protein n=1 Tax=Weissella sagaensis TaxID=2559928 RepID=UPI003518E209
MAFMIQARRSVIVYLKNVRQARQLRRFGVVNYISEKMKYAVIYMDEEDIETKTKLIERLGFVDSVSISHWPEVDTTVGSEEDSFELTVDPNELADEPIDEEEL